MKYRSICIGRDFEVISMGNRDKSFVLILVAMIVSCIIGGSLLTFIEYFAPSIYYSFIITWFVGFMIGMLSLILFVVIIGLSGYTIVSIEKLNSLRRNR